MGKNAKQAKRRKAPDPTTAAEARQTSTAIVESPYGNGCDRVTVADPVVAMVRQGRLDTRQQSAAGRYRSAFDQIYGSGASILGKDITDGGRPDGPTDRRLKAAADLRDAQRILGGFEPVVRSVVGHGHSLGEIALTLDGNRSRSAKSGVSMILRKALSALADEWYPEADRSGSVHSSERSEDLGEAGVRVVGSAAHCTTARIYRA